ncbi:MAG: adenine deaminase [Deltaproteobacteria bacterium]|nr:adenine deaminase [Deltaproteobacteria bacterium]
MPQKSPYIDQQQLASVIRKAMGQEPCDLVIKNTQFLDVMTGQFQSGDVAISGRYIVGTCETYHGAKEIDGSDLWLVPGFIDSHVHIESSLLMPPAYESLVLPLGTTTAIWDPHEIANVCGTDGIQWALDISDDLLMDLLVMLPSCVPATPKEAGLESGGAHISAQDLAKFMGHPRVIGLAEMMNYPGLLSTDDDVLQKLMLFRNHPRDGHCPMLTGYSLNAYCASGISSCHESVSVKEAQEKLSKGMNILIREGSCAKNAEALLPLINHYSSPGLALCSDDRNPSDIKEEGHLNFIINRGLAQGLPPEDVFRVASWSAARMYGLNDRAVIAPGYLADLCLLRKRSQNWQNGFDVHEVIKSGQLLSVYQKHHKAPVELKYNLNHKEISERDLELRLESEENSAEATIIRVMENQIITEKEKQIIPLIKGLVFPDPDQDLLKIAVTDRHHASGATGVALVRGFGLKKGAIGSSVNHDSHNFIVVGTDDASMLAALKVLKHCQGGIVVWENEHCFDCLPLPKGGLMSEETPDFVAKKLNDLRMLSRNLGCSLREPFLQLSFLALPVIPKIKITDKGLVDVETFSIRPVLRHRRSRSTEI